MAQPVAYTRQYDFSDFSTNFPSGQQPGTQLDAELDAVKATLDAIRTNLVLIQRDDGKPANATVHPDAFTAASLALMASDWTPRGAWATATAYVVGDLVEDSDTAYVCATAHTSGVNLAADQTKWVQLAPATGAFGATLLANATAAEALDDLGFTTFTKTLVDDADAEEARATLGSTTVGDAVFIAASAAAARTALAVGEAHGDGALATPAMSFSADPNTGIRRKGTDNLAVVTAGADAIDVKSDGAVLMPLQPAFLAYNSAADSNVTGDGTAATIDFDTEVFDRGGDFAADTFTAPVTGVYRFSSAVRLSGLTASFTTGQLILVTSNRSYLLQQAGVGAMRTAANDLILAGSVLADMDAGDTAHVTLGVSGSTKTISIDGTTAPQTFFSGELVA